MKKIILSILSAVLLTAAFPLTDWWLLAWVGLIPWFFALDRCSYKEAFFLSYLVGFLFFLFNIHWVMHVTGFGMLLMVLYLAFYFAVFGVFYVFFLYRPVSWKMVLLPSFWVVLEFMRGFLITGFEWAGLGYSQYLNLVGIQFADITGVYGVSFLLVLSNLYFKSAIQTLRSFGLKPLLSRGETFFFFSLMAFVLTYGNVQLATEYKQKKEVKIAVVQANIPLASRRNPLEAENIVTKLLTLSYPHTQNGTDLIVWSETVFPGMLYQAPELFERIKKFARIYQTPILLGAVLEEGGKYFNSAILISDQGEWVSDYRKKHLVVFGEYIPYRNLFPWLEEIVPIDDFTPGDTYHVFDLPIKKKTKFSSLICFEDTLGYLARGFTNAGAQFLVNITNDAWFKDTSAPFLHLQGSVLRAVENRRSVVRSANTGVSALISPKGEIISTVTSPRGKQTWIQGETQASLPAIEKISFYTKYGNVFTFLCFGVILLTIIKNVLKGVRVYGS